MKKSLLLCLITFSLFISRAQYQFQYFDGADTIAWSSIFVTLDTTAANAWQVGPPQKTIFDSPSTAPNVLVTDTINPYPDTLSSSAWFMIPENMLWAGAIAIQWNQQIDFELNQDGGLVEFSSDSGVTWQNAFYNSNVYNFYGWDPANESVLPSGEPCFTGTDSTWKNVWLCFLYDYLGTIDNLSIRFRIVSDTVKTYQEGWMIDNLLVAETWFHPVAEQSKPENFKVFPTLTDRVITLEQVNTSPDFKITGISLINLNGEVVRTALPANTPVTIDVSDLPVGKYLLKIVANNQTETHHIMISR